MPIIEHLPNPSIQFRFLCIGLSICALSLSTTRNTVTLLCWLLFDLLLLLLPDRKFLAELTLEIVIITNTF